MPTSVVALVVCVSLALAFPSRLHYEVNDESSFDLESSLDARGHLVSNGQRTQGSYATLDSNLVTQCVQEDDSSYYFVMNLFFTTVDAGQGKAASKKSSIFERGWDDDGGDDDGGDDDDDPNALGEDMYFQQSFDGKITNIWYSQTDSLFFVNIKVGAINALQTHILPQGAVQTFMVEDPVGNHTARFQGLSQAADLVVQQDFSQLDVQAFPDPNLSPGNVNIQATTVTGITPYPQVSDNGGYIVSSTVSQLVDLTNISPGGSQKVNGRSDPTALDARLSSLGSVSIKMNQFLQKPSNPRLRPHKIEELAAKGYVKDTLFGVAKKGIQAKPLENLNVVATLERILADEDADPAGEVKAMNRLIRHLNRAGEVEAISSYAKRLSSMIPAARKKLLYILAGVNGPKAVEMLVSYGMESSDAATQVDSIVASVGISPANIDERLMRTLESLSLNGTDEVRKAAVLSFGSAIGRSNDRHTRTTRGRALLSQLASALSGTNVDALVSVVHAVGNAGPAIRFDAIPWDKLLSHEDGNVRVAAAGALRKFNHRDYAMSAKLAKAPVDPSNFPYNRSWSDDFFFGGSEVNADFKALLFAGTNFDCNHEYFNYEALAQADANFVFFDWSKEAFLAEAIYGKVNGQLVGNQIYLRVWDDVIYNQQIPTLDCSEHVYPLYHTQQGISVSYTLWVSVIPVTFTATASAVVDLKWGWQICDDKLSAQVELIPDVTIVLDGDAEVYLLIAKAGAELSGSIDAQVRPQGTIDGSACTVGFDVRFESNPAEIDLDSYYQFQTCKYWIFDCKWGDRHQQTWYSWSSSAQNEVIFDQSWKIAAN